MRGLSMSPNDASAHAGPSTLAAAASRTNGAPLSPGSPPPYSLDPPEANPNSPFLAKRAASSPHLSPPSSPHDLPVYPRSHGGSRRPSSSNLNSYAPSQMRQRAAYARSETEEDDTDTALSGDDAVFYRAKQRASEPGLAATLRERLFGKGKGRADASGRVRFITTAPGLRGAGETETEGEDAPRNLPTARLTASVSLSNLSPLSESMTIPISSSSHSCKPRTSLALGPILFEFSRLLSIVPAIFGTLWNLYHTARPPNDEWTWSIEYAVCVLWSILTGWQCLQLTSGLFKRWRVYYSPFATLIRLFALQAICWPATHLTLTILNHETRPLVCWAAIGTTTCCSRSIQMWVTSNIVEPPSHPNTNTSDVTLKRRYRRKWDWNAVLRECVLPAGLVYFVMAWALVLRHELDGGRS